MADTLSFHFESKKSAYLRDKWFMSIKDTIAWLSLGSVHGSELDSDEYWRYRKLACARAHALLEVLHDVNEMHLRPANLHDENDVNDARSRPGSRQAALEPAVGTRSIPLSETAGIAVKTLAACAAQHDGQVCPFAFSSLLPETGMLLLRPGPQDAA